MKLPPGQLLTRKESPKKSQVSSRSLRSKKGFPHEHGEKPFEVGRDDWIRTSDLTHPKRARYQAAPRPVKTFQYDLKECFVKVALFPKATLSAPLRAR